MTNDNDHRDPMNPVNCEYNSITENNRINMPIATSHAKSLDNNNLSYGNVDDSKYLEIYDISNGSQFPNTARNYTICDFNIRSLQKHCSSLQDILHHFKKLPKIIALCETRLQRAPISNVDISGYRFIHSPSPTKAGGVGIYIQIGIPFTCTDSYRLSCENVEQLWIEIHSQIPGAPS